MKCKLLKGFPAFGKISSNYWNFQIGLVDTAPSLFGEHYSNLWYTEENLNMAVCLFWGDLQSSPGTASKRCGSPKTRQPWVGQAWLLAGSVRLKLQQRGNHGNTSTHLSVTKIQAGRNPTARDWTGLWELTLPYLIMLAINIANLDWHIRSWGTTSFSGVRSC